MYIRTAKSLVERLLDLNFRMILKEIPLGDGFFVTGNGCITLVHWNVGLTIENCKLRSVILHSLKPDIFSLNETQLFNDKGIHFEGYIWFGFNRMKHIKAHKGSGGVGVCIKKDLLEQYTIDVIDKEVEGILRLKFFHLNAGCTFIVFTYYLPPETSIWGKDASYFFNHLLSQIYLG